MDADIKAVTEATAGAVGGVLSTTILYPLDTCKTKFQAEAKADGTNKYRNLLDVFREAVACGNVLSLYQGLGTKNGHAVLSGFVYFYSYSYIKSKYLHRTGARNMSTAANLVVAAAAGACTACITQPLDTLSARMQTSKPGEAKGLTSLLREGGLRHAFDGLGVSLILTLNPAIQYTVFEQLKVRMLEWQQAALPMGRKEGPVALSAFSAFLLGALSKCLATVVTYPLIRCKVMMQRAATEEERRSRAGGDAQAGPPANMLQAFRVIWRSEGVPGLYKGLNAQILKTVLAAALMLMIKEKVSEGTRTAVVALYRLLAAQSRQASSRAGSSLPDALPAAAAAAAIVAGVPAASGPAGPTRRPVDSLQAVLGTSPPGSATRFQPPSIHQVGAHRPHLGLVPQPVDIVASDGGSL